MAAVSPMECVDIAIKIANVVQLFKERRPGLHALQAMLEKYQQMFERLQATDLQTGDVVVEVQQSVLADLELCRARLNDGSWLNKVNVKRAMDEKKDAEATQRRLAEGLQRLHTDLMLALQQRNMQQFRQIQDKQVKDAAACNKELKQLQRQLKLMQEDGENIAEDMQIRVESLKIMLGILEVSQAQVLQQGQEHFAVLSRNQDQMMKQSHAQMQQNQKHFVALQENHAAIMKQSEAQFKCLNEQGRLTLQEVRAGFLENKQLFDEVKAAVHSSKGHVIDAVRVLSQTGDNYQRILLSKLEEVLRRLEQLGFHVTPETAEHAMNT